MGIYSKYILPRLINWAMGDKKLAPLREKLLSQTGGTVLEIGFGTGANLAYYPKSVDRILAVENHEQIFDLAKKRISQFPGKVEKILSSAEQLPLDICPVDFAVSTMTLCSVTDVFTVLQRIKHVLKPGGKFLFLEHGLSPDRKVQKWQNRLTPIQKRIGGNCHFNRNILGLLADACFDVEKQESFYLEKTPKIVYLTMGQAR